MRIRRSHIISTQYTIQYIILHSTAQHNTTQHNTMKHYSTSTRYYLTTVHKIKHNTILLHCSIKHYFTSLHATSVTEPLTALYIRNNHKNNYQNIVNKIQNKKLINKCRHKIYDETEMIISTHTHTFNRQKLLKPKIKIPVLGHQ